MTVTRTTPASELSRTLRKGRREEAAVQPPSALARLIHPVDAETFKRSHWEHEPLVVTRNDPNYYEDLLTLDDVDYILATSSLHSSDLRVLADGRETPLSKLVTQNREGAANGLEALYDRYRAGSTINLTLLHERWEPLGRLCHSLAAELTAAVQTNVYLTPSGARGLAAHYDTHDVFVAQVYGSKHWRLYESPVQLPLPEQPHTAPEQGYGRPVRELDLEPGDLLYLPRGFVHDATANHAASLHLTIGILPVLWASVVRDAVDQALAEDVRFREALPLGFALDEALQEQARARVAQLLDALRASASPDSLIGSAARRALFGSRPVLRKHLLDLEAVGSVDLDTPVHRRPGLLWRLADDDASVRLEFHGKEVRLPGHVAEEVRFVTETEEFSGRDIPGRLDEPGRLVLIRSLLREGFLTLAAA